MPEIIPLCMVKFPWLVSLPHICTPPPPVRAVLLAIVPPCMMKVPCTCTPPPQLALLFDISPPCMVSIPLSKIITPPPQVLTVPVSVFPVILAPSFIIRVPPAHTCTRKLSLPVLPLRVILFSSTSVTPLSTLKRLPFAPRLTVRIAPSPRRVIVRLLLPEGSSAWTGVRNSSWFIVMT